MCTVSCERAAGQRQDKLWVVHDRVFLEDNLVSRILPASSKPGVKHLIHGVAQKNERERKESYRYPRRQNPPPGQAGAESHLVGTPQHLAPSYRSGIPSPRKLSAASPTIAAGTESARLT